MIIEVLPAQPPEQDREELRELLRACVAGGASIGFLSPLSSLGAEAYWDKVIQDAGTGNRLILTAREDTGSRIVGSVQLACESRANGRHRAEVQKLMVLPECRRRGIAAWLMDDLEARAKLRGVSLLFLDTSDGEGGARAFYEALSYTYVGGIPGYALDPDGKPAKNAIYYKTI